MSAIIEKLQKLDSGQKVKLGLTAVLLLFVLYLLPGLFGDATPAASNKALSNTQMVRPNVHTVQSSGAGKSKVLHQKDLGIRDSQLLSAAQDSQKMYLRAVTQLKMLELEQKIVTAKKTIAKERLETLKAEHSIHMMEAPLPPSPASYARKLVKPVSAPVVKAPAVKKAVVNHPMASYKLLYVANEGGTWQAILGGPAGKFYNVAKGTVLPDGSKVTDINGTNVTLEKNKVQRNVSITPII